MGRLKVYYSITYARKIIHDLSNITDKLKMQRLNTFFVIVGLFLVLLLGFQNCGQGGVTFVQNGEVQALSVSVSVPEVVTDPPPLLQLFVTLLES